jgi:hypothetical protein
MDRRDFLTASISSVLAAVGLGAAATTETEHVEEYGGETAATEACDQCVKLAAFKKRCRTELVPNDQYNRVRLREWVDPKNHTWEDDCLYADTPPADADYSKEDVQEMDYDIHVSSPRPGLIDVTVTMKPTMPLRFIENTVTVGDVE